VEPHRDVPVAVRDRDGPDDDLPRRRKSGDPRSSYEQFLNTFLWFDDSV
jgi:hypothetical protein